MAAPCSLAPELKTHAPHSSMSPYRRAMDHSCLPSFHQNLVFTLPVSKTLYLRHIIEFQNAQLLGTPRVQITLFFPGRVSPCFCLLLTQWFTVYVNTEQKAGTLTHCSQPASMLLCLGTVQHLGHTCDHGYPESTVSHLRFCPALPPEHL